MNKKVLGIAGLAAVTVVGGTFAYFNQTSTVENPFDTAKYGSVVTEDFKPEDGNNWKPGVEVNKDLVVTNTGDQAVVVRVKFEDIWTDAETAGKVKNVNAKDSLTVEQGNITDGKVDADKSVVHKNFANSEDWKLADDGWYYYTKKVEAGKSTDKFLDSVQLDKDADMGAYEIKQYYSEEDIQPSLTDLTEANGWNVWNVGSVMPETAKHTAVFKELVSDSKGYADANYVLKITTQTVQATDKAVAAVFAADQSVEGSVAVPASVVEGWGLEVENNQTETTEAAE